MHVDVAGTRVELVRGDIASQGDVDAVVNAANAQLRIGGGVAGAIHRAAGPELAEECKAYAPIEPGEAVTTGGHELPNEWVIHVLGPRYGKDEPAGQLLAACYENALAECSEHGIDRVAFPAVSTGAFGYPLRAAAEIALATVLDEVRGRGLELVRFVLYGADALEVHEAVLEELFDEG